MKYSLICKNALKIVDDGRTNYKIEEKLFETSAYQLQGSKRLRIFCNVGDKKILVSTTWDMGSKTYITKTHNTFHYNDDRYIINWDDYYEFYITDNVSEAVQNHFNLIDIMRELNDKIRRNDYNMNNNIGNKLNYK